MPCCTRSIKGSLQAENLINPSPHEKMLDETKLKAFADDILNVTKMIIPVFDRSENIVGKRRNCLYRQFLLFPQCFQRASLRDPSKGVIVWEWVKQEWYCSNNLLFELYPQCGKLRPCSNNRIKPVIKETS